jgi:hypothetical protein
MNKKLTLMIDEQVYDGLRRKIGPRKISRFVEDLVRPHVLGADLEDAYAAMAKDAKREKEAWEWSEMTFKDANRETR